MDIVCPTCGFRFTSDQAGGLCPACLAAMAVRSSAPPPPENPLEDGQLFHGFQVVNLVARGGMGIVYRARRPDSPRDLALKILPRELGAEAEFRRRFDREARALIGLNHPNIVNVFDYGVEGDLMFLVMDFVEGVSLRKELRGGKRLPPARAYEIAIDLCGALDFAHSQGVVHRDLKPDNVLIDLQNRVKLTDFGLAKQTDLTSTQFTQSNLVIGTPHYMSPEQLERPKEVDHRADIYSMGVLLYEMLTGELPIGRFPAPSRRAEVSAVADSLILRCLEKEPERRFATVAALKVALQELAGKPAPRPAPVRKPSPGNVEILCPCGAPFLVPAAARGAVHCPTCGGVVRIGGPTPVPASSSAKAPEDKPASAISSPPRRIPRVWVAAGAGLLVLLGIGAIVIASLSPNPPSQNISYVPRKLEVPDLDLPPTPPPKAAAPLILAAVPPVAPPVDPAALRRQIEAGVTQANLAGLVATILLYSGRPDGHDQLQSRIAQIDRDLRDIAAYLRQAGQATEIPDHFRSGDRIAAFGKTRVQPFKTISFADELRTWLRAFKPGAREDLIVIRDRQERSFGIVFPEQNAELEGLAREAGVGLGETPPAAPLQKPDAAITLPLPEALRADLRKRLDALPPFYRLSLPNDDRTRAEMLLASGKGSPDDAAFLNGRFNDLLSKSEAEVALIPIRIRELQSRLGEGSSSLATVYFKDGRKIEGTILEETEETLKLKGRYGALTEPKSAVLRIERGRGAATEFKGRYETAKTRKEELLTLLSWCREKSLNEPRELCAWTILSMDPGDARARAELSLSASPAVLPAAGPAERLDFHGRSYTPDQLRLELKSLGYIQHNGIWCEKVARSLKIDNLYRDDQKLNALFRGASIQAITEKSDSTAYDYRTKSWVPRSKLVNVARYIGGVGTCSIDVVAPGELLEARVHARGQVARVGGFVSVSVECDKGSKTLYTLAAPSENDSSYDVTDVVAGATHFLVKAETRGEGMFLPSDSNDLGVFEVKYSYAKPLDKVNAIFSSLAPAAETLDLAQRGAAEQAEARIRAGAIVAAKREGLNDAIGEMRALTDDVFYPRDFSMPAKYAEIAASMKDPLSIDWKGLSRDQGLRLGTWWGTMSASERVDFMNAYGLWCARTRAIRAAR